MPVTIATDPAVVARFSAETQAGSIRLRDENLIEALAATDRPPGLVYVADAVRLSADVTGAGPFTGSGLPPG